MRWIDFPSAHFEVRGLPWIEENTPRLWRLPGRAAKQVREPVWNLGRFPSGGRIRFPSNTSRLGIRAVYSDFVSRQNMSAIGARGLDVYVDGRYWNSVCAKASGEETHTFFDGASRVEKEMMVYLPLFQELQVLAIGLDEDAEVREAAPFAHSLPVVFYGSSVAQGSGACRPGMTYEAILARNLNLDYVDLGFGGNGRAEAEVVELIAGIEACCFVFDLGKSYGRQPASAYTRMLETIRAAHPDVPLICITPIFSTREMFDADYRDLSLHTRKVVVKAVDKRLAAGDEGICVLEGMDLLGPEDADGFHEGVHPTDYGFYLIAERLSPVVERALGL